MIIRNQFGRAAQAVTEPTHVDAVLEGFLDESKEVVLAGGIYSPEENAKIELTPTEKRIANLAKARAAKAAKKSVE